MNYQAIVCFLQAMAFTIYIHFNRSIVQFSDIHLCIYTNFLTIFIFWDIFWAFLRLYNETFISGGEPNAEINIIFIKIQRRWWNKWRLMFTQLRNIDKYFKSLYTNSININNLICFQLLVYINNPDTQ